MADPSSTDDVKPLNGPQNYWLTLEEAEKEVKAHEERTGTRYNLAKADPSFGSSCEYRRRLPAAPPAPALWGALGCVEGEG